MKSIGAKTWGTDRKVLLQYYTAAVRTRLDYGCHIYDAVSENIPKQLNVIQNQCNRIAAGARNKTPIISLLVKANIEPLHIRCKFLTIKYYNRVMKMPENSPLLKDNNLKNNKGIAVNSFFY